MTETQGVVGLTRELSDEFQAVAAQIAERKKAGTAHSPR